MNKIERMLQELCPNGVEYKKLGEVCEILDSKRKPVAKGRRTSGIYPYYGANGIQDYVDDYIFDGTFILLGEDGSVINADKSPVLNWAVGKIWVNNHAHILAEISSIANLRYLYFVLQTKDVSSIVRGTPPKLNQENLRNIEIPIPPLPVQEEIVRILDNFTELTASLQAELQAELQARQEQYEYYRNRLLTFTKIGGGTQSVTWMKMSEICYLQRGKVYSKEYLRDNQGNYPVYSSQTMNNGELGRISTYDFDGTYLTWTTDGAYAGTIFKRKGKFSITNVCGIISMKSNLVSMDFLYYWLSLKAKEYVYSGMGNPKLMSNQVEKISVPIFSMSEQQRIVSILDKFETLVNDLSQGLPAEIAAVQEQYEYYRNKLLTFNRLN